jgi:hypothetical protein
MKFPEVPVVWLAVFPSEKRWVAWDRIRCVNSLVKEYNSHGYKMYYVDCGKKFLGKGGKPNSALYRDDKLHFNEKGYALWAKSFRKKFNQIVSK